MTVFRAISHRWLVLLLLSVFLAGCWRSPGDLIVGSKNETEQLILGEIVAQHLEARLGRPVQRRIGLGNTAVLYRAILDGNVSIYPEYTGLISYEILRESPSRDPQALLDRTRKEMSRVAQLELLDPLGFNNPPAIVIRDSEAPEL